MDYSLQGAATDRKAPALPIKQRRSLSSSSSSAPDLQLEGTLNVPGSSPLSSPFTDVFAAPTDCNATQCPIHHRYETSGYHQERFFSDQTPPPIPKKKLARTLSLPIGPLLNNVQPLMRPHYIKSSPYMAENPPLDHAGEHKKEHTLKAYCFNQLTFDTPDQHLPGFFSSFCHQEQVYVGIQNRYLEFVKNAVKHLEAQVLLELQVEWVRTLQPQDFVICENPQPEKMEQDVFYVVHIPKVPEGFFSAKVHRKDSVSTCPVPLLPHPNVEEVLAHFSPCMAQKKQHLSELLAVTEASELSHEGSAELSQESDTVTKGDTVLSFLERGHAVTIVRDFPWGTLEDFVQEGISLHHLQPVVYERRLCLLILQLALGLQHLESHNVKHAELRTQRIMLVWLHIKSKRSKGRVEAIGDLKDVKKRNWFAINTDYSERECTGKGNILHENRNVKRVHTLWDKWGTPRVVINHTDVQIEPFQDIQTNAFQLGALLKFCLHQHMDQNTEYTSGLLRLISQLTGENPGLQMVEVVGVLQALLWGPRAGLFEKNQPNTTVLHNWLTVKRSLLMLKLAEKGLFSNQNDLDWEEYLCLQYIAFAEPETVLKTTAQLGLYSNVRLV
ncbi:hypothetical protein SRHO_G00167780 [Serrasalmus rhombeus]